MTETLLVKNGLEVATCAQGTFGNLLPVMFLSFLGAVARYVTVQNDLCPPGKRKATTEKLPDKKMIPTRQQDGATMNAFIFLSGNFSVIHRGSGRRSVTCGG